MNTEKFKILADKFFEGNTSIQEERDLKHYVEENQIPEGYEALADQLLFFNRMGKDQAIPEKMEERLIHRIEEQQKNQKSSRLVLFRRILTTSAAAVLFFFAVQTIYQSSEKNNNSSLTTKIGNTPEHQNIDQNKQDSIVQLNPVKK